MATIKELLTRNAGTEGSKIIPKKILAELIAAVEKKRIGRSLAARYIGPEAIPGSSIDINLEDPDSMVVVRVAEGAAVPLDTFTISSFNMKPVKYGVRPAITKEMMEDSQFELLALNVSRAGVELAENEDALIITDALDNAGNTVSGGANITIANITRAMQYLEDNDYTPTDLLVGPEVANDLRNIDTFVEADKLGSREAFTNGLIGRIFGMDVKVFSANIGTTTSAYCIDRSHAFVITEKRPVTINEYDDVTHDLSGVVLTQRIKIRHLRANAIAKITTT